MPWFDAKDEAFTSLEAEPSFGSSLDVVDLRHEFLSRFDAKSTWESKSSLTLANGTPVLIAATRLPGGRVLKQGFKATIVDPALVPK